MNEYFIELTSGLGIIIFGNEILVFRVIEQDNVLSVQMNIDTLFQSINQKMLITCYMQINDKSHFYKIKNIHKID